MEMIKTDSSMKQRKLCLLIEILKPWQPPICCSMICWPSLRPSPFAPSHLFLCPLSSLQVVCVWMSGQQVLPSVVDALRGIPQFSAKLEAALAEAFPEKANDPFYGPSFDPIDYINEKFPDEKSMSGGKLDDTLSKLRSDLIKLNDDITSDVRRHSDQRTQTQLAIGSASNSIQTLFNKIKDIKEKAAQSEYMVREICRDITALHNAKNNLKLTINALRNLHMLILAVGQIKEWVDKREYTEAARLFKAIMDLFSLFEPYKHVHKIAMLTRQVDTLKTRLREMVLVDLHAHLATVNPSIDEAKARKLAGACTVMDSLEDEYKRDFIKWFVQVQMEPYEALFGLGREGYSLDAVPRRHAWLKREVKRCEVTFQNVFPQHWYIWAQFSYGFCAVTRAHISSHLNMIKQTKIAASTGLSPTGTAAPGSNRSGQRPAPPVPTDSYVLPPPTEAEVNTLVAAMTACIKIEKELAVKFADCAPTKKPLSKAELQAKKAEEEAAAERAKAEAAAQALAKRKGHMAPLPVAAQSVDEIRAKYKRGTGEGPSSSPFGEAESKGALHSSSPSSSPSSSSSTSASHGAFAPGRPIERVEIDFEGCISSCFLPHLNGMVQVERKHIDDIIDKLMRDEQWSGPPGIETKDLKPKTRLAGADELFLFFKKSIARCASLTTGEVFAKLWREYLSGLTRYCELLEMKVRNREMASVENSATRAESIRVWGLILNTAEYIVDTLPDLANSVKKRIDPELEDGVVVDNESTQFTEVLHRAVTAIANLFDHRFSFALSEMTRRNWAAWSSVGDQSEYVTQIHHTLLEDMPALAALLSSRYHSYTCTQVVAALMTKLLQSVYKCRRISQTGAQQLALDCHALKAVLLDVPLIHLDTAGKPTVATGGKIKPAPAIFQKLVRKEMGKVEALIKVLQTPYESLVPTLKALQPGAGLEELRQIMELQGLKKSEQVECIRQFSSGGGDGSSSSTTTSSSSSAPPASGIGTDVLSAAGSTPSGAGAAAAAAGAKKGAFNRLFDKFA